MQDPEPRISRRTALKGAAASGVGIVVGRSLAEQSSKQMGASSEAVFGIERRVVCATGVERER